MVFIIVSRHEGTVKFLKEYIKSQYRDIPEKFLDERISVVDHLTDPEIQIPFFSEVYGNMPLPLVKELFEARGITAYYAVSLDLPRELRGTELSYEVLKKYISLLRLDHLDGEVITF